MAFTDDFIVACFGASRKEFKSGKPILRISTPDRYSTHILDLTQWDPSKETIVDFIAKNALDWFNQVIDFYTTDADGNIVRKQAGVEYPDVDVDIQALLAKAKDLGVL